VCAPLRIEDRAVRKALPGVDVLRTGMGPAKAASVAGELAGHPAGAVAVAGFCGALDDNLAPGHVVVASEVHAPDGTVTPLPAHPFLVAALREQGIDAHVGPLVTVDHIVHGSERAELAARTKAIAVDMESAPIVQAAGERPVAVLRVVSDSPSQELARLGVVRALFTAQRALRGAAGALRPWSEAAGPRSLLLAAPRSFCAGVERAIEVVERVLERRGPPVYVRKQIVHNAHVVADLRRRGAVFVEELDEVPEGATVVFSAHGVAPSVREQAQRRELDVVDATCPLVAKVHAEARRFARRGDTVVLIGHDGHEEVEGTLGEAPGSVVLVEDAEQAASVDIPDQRKVSYLMQTTLAVDESERVVGTLRQRFPDLDGPGSDDICYATSNRQDAVRAIADESDLLLVVGSTNSSNSKRLVELAERGGTPARLVDDATGVDPSWLAGAGTVGITAGASAPPPLVDALVDALAGLGPVTRTERSVTTETVHFALPKEVN
jgi:4-hydroxy-3-methylbut-2-enyl diphosphate reductase